MSTLSATIASIDFGDALKGLDAMGRRGVLAPAFKTLKAPLRIDQREHAAAQSGPGGSWAPRAQSTIDRHRNKPRLPRKQLGRLPTAVSYSASARGVVGESRVAWSSIHQDGGTAGHGARIPARPFLWISDKFLGIATDALTGVVLAAFGGGS